MKRPSLKGARIKCDKHPSAPEGEQFAKVVGVGRIWVYARGEKTDCRLAFSKITDDIEVVT